MMAAMEVMESSTKAPSSNTSKTPSTKAVSPVLSAEKRERSDNDDDEAEMPTRRVLQRTDHHSDTPDEEQEKSSNMTSLILTGLRSNDEDVLVKAMDKLKQTLKSKDSIQKEFFLLGGHYAVVSALCDHVDCKAIQESGLFVLANAARGNNNLRMAIPMVNGIEAILAAMNKYPFEENIQTFGAVALCNLTIQHKANAQALVVDHAAIPFLTETIKTFSGIALHSAQVVKSACLLLKILCEFQELKETILKAKAPSALMMAFDEHEDHTVRQRAQRAIRLLMEEDV